MSTELTEPTIWRDDYFKYIRSLHGDKRIEDVPLENIQEIRLVEDDGKSYWDWGEKITPKCSYKMVYVTTRLMEFANCAEYETNKTEFVVPDQFVEDLQNDKVHFIVFKRDGKEIKYRGKYRLTRID